MASFETKINSSGLYGAREIAREKLASISTVKIHASTTNRIEIRIDSGEQSSGVIRTTVSEGHDKKRTVSAR
jgi:hypothetical protein